MDGWMDEGHMLLRNILTTLSKALKLPFGFPDEGGGWWGGGGRLVLMTQHQPHTLHLHVRQAFCPQTLSV